MPKQDVDLVGGGFRIDLKTGLLLAALLGQWYDGRSQNQQAAALQAVRDQSTSEKIVELNSRLVEIQAYLSNLKASLAAADVADVDGKPIRR